MQFFTRNNERMRIEDYGNVGIGTTSPTKLLDVNGNVRVRNLGNDSLMGLVCYDTMNVLRSLQFPGSISNVLLGNGTWGVSTDTVIAALNGLYIDSVIKLGGNLIELTEITYNDFNLGLKDGIGNFGSRRLLIGKGAADTTKAKLSIYNISDTLGSFNILQPLTSTIQNSTFLRVTNNPFLTNYHYGIMGGMFAIYDKVANYIYGINTILATNSGGAKVGYRAAVHGTGGSSYGLVADVGDLPSPSLGAANIQVGVSGYAHNGSNTNTGGRFSGSDGGVSYGVSASATDGTLNYAVHATASGSGTGWSGYFLGPGYLSASSWSYGSDILLKDNIIELSNNLGIISQLRDTVSRSV